MFTCYTCHFDAPAGPVKMATDIYDTLPKSPCISNFEQRDFANKTLTMAILIKEFEREINDVAAFTTTMYLIKLGDDFHMGIRKMEQK